MIVGVVSLMFLFSIWLSVQKIPEYHLGIVETKKGFQRVLQPGINMTIPFYEKVKAVFPNKDVSFQLPTLQIHDKHHVRYKIDLSCTYDVANPVFYFYQKEKIENDITYIVEKLVTAYYEPFTTEEILFTPFDQYGKIKKELQKQLLKYQLTVYTIQSLGIQKPL